MGSAVAAVEARFVVSVSMVSCSMSFWALIISTRSALVSPDRLASVSASCSLGCVYLALLAASVTSCSISWSKCEDRVLDASSLMSGVVATCEREHVTRDAMVCVVCLY